MRRLNLTLSWPPTVNKYWRHVLINGHVRTLISAEGRQYKRRVVQEVLSQCKPKTIMGRVRLDIVLYPPDRRKLDIDNRLKALCDAITDAHVWRDDEQIDEIHMVRGTVKSGGSVRVWIEELEPKQAQGKLL